MSETHTCFCVYVCVFCAEEMLEVFLRMKGIELVSLNSTECSLEQRVLQCKNNRIMEERHWGKYKILCLLQSLICLWIKVEETCERKEARSGRGE